MANLQIKGMKDELYGQLKELAAAENRSISQEILFLLKMHLAKTASIRTAKTPAQVLLELSGSWADTRPAAEIVSRLKTDRRNSLKLADGF